jgi:uncharacterized delta-60 repeat protein
MSRRPAASLERLEQRALLSTSIQVGDINADETTHTVQVTYSDPDGINSGTIDATDLSVSGPKQVAVSVTNVDITANTAIATYALTGPDGSWDRSDNGGYGITVAAGNVKDNLGNDLEGAVANFDVNIPAPPDTTAPAIAGGVDNITTAGATNHTAFVIYSDDSGINVSSIDKSDITVTRNSDGSTLNVIGVSVTGPANTKTAVYTFDAPGAAWDFADNGDYTVTLHAGAVTDASFNANGNPGAAKLFNVNIPDPTGPTASVTGIFDIEDRADTPHQVVVTYQDADGIDASTVGTDDITVVSGNKTVAVTGVTTQVNSPTSLAVFYTLDAGGPEWRQTQNGTYTIAAKAGAVTDTKGNASTAGSAQWTINVGAPVSTVEVPGIDTETVSALVKVNYRSDFGVTLSTIGPNDLTFSKPGVTVSKAEILSADPQRQLVTVGYTVVGPGGNWDATDNGECTVSLNGNAVRDDANNTLAFVPDFIGIGIQPNDTTPPAVSFDTLPTITASASSFNVVVTYTDDRKLNTSTIDVSDLVVARAGEAALPVSNVSVNTSADGKTAVATYTLVPPAGTSAFGVANNGVYAVQVQAGTVFDVFGNENAVANASLTVAIVAPPPPDQAGPTAQISAGDINTPGGDSQTVTVVFTDDGKVKVGSIGVDDIVVTRGGTTLQVTDVSTTSSDGGKKVTATYTLAAPGGTWDTADNGAYTITLPAGAVQDTKGNDNQAASGGFTVNATIQDNASPVATNVSAGNIIAEGVTKQLVTVTYSDDVALDLTTIGTDDVSVSGPSGNLAVDVVNVSSGADGKSATVTYTFAAPGSAFQFEDNGTYTITVNAGAVKDTAGKGVDAASGSFQVALPEPTPVDPGFGVGSSVVTSFVAESVTTSSSGKVLIAGRTGNSAVLEVRNADGTLDTTFNKNGQVVSTVDNAYYSVVAQGDKIVVGGTQNGNFVFVRYNADGKIDPTFGINGRLVVDFGQDNDAAYAMAIAPDGKIVAAGQSDGNFAFARLSADGRLDPTFDQGGLTLFDLGGTDLAGAVVVQSDGKIVAAGTSNGKVAVVRLQSNGLADSTAFGSASPFSGDGMLTIDALAARNDPTVQDRSAALALQADGKILVGNHTAGDDFGIVRVTTLGNIDSSFGNDGVAVADFGGSDDADAIIVQPTGEILVVGTSLSGSTGETTIAAFDSSGHLIDAFGTGGKFMLDANLQPTSARELHVGDLVLRAFGTRQSDGRLVIGTTNSAPQQTSNSQFVRLNVPGTRAVPSGSQLGTFGVVNGRPQKLIVTDADGTRITFSIKGGTGTAFLGADNKINLILTNDGTGCTVKISGKGGDGRIALGDVSGSGAVKSFAAKTADLSGVFCVTGTIGKLTLGNVSSGVICSSGNITGVSAASLTGAKILAGANLGADADFGGTGADADTYSGASIGFLKVGGQIVGSTIGAGLDPVDSTFLDDDDRVVGGEASFIKSIIAKGADDTTRFVAGKFGKIKLGGKPAPNDPRFEIL